MFGILPNSDGKENYVSNMNVNYHPSLSSSVTMYDKKFYTAKNTVTSDELTNEITATDRRDININLLDYNPSLFRFALYKDLTLKLHFSIGADYTQETVRYSYDEWDDAGFKVMHPMWIIQEKRDRTTYLPEASLKFTLANTGYFRWGFQSSYQFRNIEKIKIERYDSLLKIGDNSSANPTEHTYTIDTLYFSDNQTKNSSGFSLKTNLQFYVYFGVLGFDLYYLYKKGESILQIKDKDGNGYDYYDSIAVTSKQTRIEFNVYYQMTYLRFLGIEPILRFGYQKQEVLNNGEADKFSTYNKYDFEVAFKY